MSSKGQERSGEPTGSALARRSLRVAGIVQGVGFRPFVYRLASELELGGFILNDQDGVLIEIEGPVGGLDRFCERLTAEAPPLSRITGIETGDVVPVGEKDFRITPSEAAGDATTLISPDVATCEDCLAEMTDPADRRYRYPFINCTNCGPRFTIVRSIPYDRPFTSMSIFPLCDDCEKEYHDPSNRRFHAQPNACPVCGPALTLTDGDKEIVCSDPIRATVALLGEGRVVAVRGLGGFHLAVDATNEKAVRQLRFRKGRAQKPFALMARNLETVRRFCRVSPAEEQTLTHHTRPIVLLRKRSADGLAPSVAPDNLYLGFMLPYTPLHHLLLGEDIPVLVMTSGNLAEEPIAIANDEAIRRLKGLADYFLLHNRDIIQRCDDSIVRYSAGRVRLIRRARGYVPQPVEVPVALEQPVLACGGELKNTIALGRNSEVFLSQHIGDLDNPAAYEFFEHCLRHFRQILQIQPRVIAYDQHPEYLSTKWALKQENLPLVPVQHHHAHLVSVMADNGVSDPTIGIILDGTGYGSDGTIWGGEILVGDAAAFERVAWLQPVAMPGGTAAIRQPWRMALSWLAETCGENIRSLRLPMFEQVSSAERDMVLKMIERRFNSPLTSSCGRLFDAVSAMLGLCTEINYEAQAAIALEMIAQTDDDTIYDLPYNKIGKGPLSVIPLVRAVVAEIEKGEPVERISGRFHRSLGELLTFAVCFVRQTTGLNRVGLSGGVYQNSVLFEYMIKRLEKENFTVLTHRHVPTNDGGIALGQVVIADAAMKRR